VTRVDQTLTVLELDDESKVDGDGDGGDDENSVAGVEAVVEESSGNDQAIGQATASIRYSMRLVSLTGSVLNRHRVPLLLPRYQESNPQNHLMDLPVKIPPRPSPPSPVCPKASASTQTRRSTA
jgi:hypothetical protein